MKTKKFALNFLCKIVNEMKNEDDNIQFEQMPDLDWGKVQKPKPIKEIEKEYDSLYDELLDKCNPSRFKIESVGLDRFNIANEIYTQLKSGGSNIPEAVLIALRNQAMRELQIHISTKKKFSYLKSFFDPEIYINRTPYDGQRVSEAGTWYDLLLKKADDIQALEKLELDADEFIQEEKRFQQNTIVDEEEVFFREMSASDYLRQYPNGQHIDEVKCLLYEGSKTYLKQYPQGRYQIDAENDIISNRILAFVGFMFIVIIIVAIAFSE